MKRLLTLLALCALAAPLSAAWHPELTPTYLRVEVGETNVVHVRAVWTGIWVLPWSEWVFDTTNPSVAVATGRMTSSLPYDVSVSGIAPGFAYLKVHSYSPEYVQIQVVCGKEDPIHPAAARVRGALGTPVTLTVVTPIAHRMTFTWYRGHVGDLSSPLPNSGPELTFTPRHGSEPVWVLATTPCSTSTAEFLVEVPVRRRSVRF